MRIVDAGFVKSVTDIGQRKGVAGLEICFVGRSNVGKSSLINTLAGRKVARTSSTPGATRLINLYSVRIASNGSKSSAIFSDFPGFGFSKVSKGVFENWQAMIETYMLGNDGIRNIVWLFDIRRDFDRLDAMLLEWLNSNSLPFSFVLTKADKESRSRCAERRQFFQRLLGCPDVFIFSSKDGLGKKELLAHIGQALQEAIS